MSSKGVMLTRIAADRRVRFFGKCRFDLSLRSLRDELVFLGQMHQHGRMKPLDLSQIFLSVTAVISDRSVDAVAHGCQKDHQRAEAIAEERTLAGAPRQLGHGVDSVLSVPGTGVPVIGLIETKAVMPIGLGDDAKVDTRLLTPEQVGRDRNEASFGQFVAGLTDVGGHTEHILRNDDGGGGHGLRPRDIGGKRAVPAFDGDAIFHWVLRKRRHSSGSPPMSSGSAEAHYRASRVQPAGTRWANKEALYAVAAAP